MADKERMLQSGGGDLLASQYFSNLEGPSSPEQRLMAAILKDAIDEFLKNAFRIGRREDRLFKEVAAWITSRDRSWVFSFENCCLALNLNPDYIRLGLKRQLKLQGKKWEEL